jgi:hypothetical protein
MDISGYGLAKEMPIEIDMYLGHDNNVQYIPMAMRKCTEDGHESHEPRIFI